LESMGKGVEEDTIKTAIKLQAPEACENIIDILDRTTNEKRRPSDQHGGPFFSR
jgi:SOS response regulatory protein OraA/RecX